MHISQYQVEEGPSQQTLGAAPAPGVCLAGLHAVSATKVFQTSCRVVIYIGKVSKGRLFLMLAWAQVRRTENQAKPSELKGSDAA